LAAARAVGEKVVVVSTSTGGTLAAAAALDADMSQDVAGMIFVSPNFGVNDPSAPLLTFPGGRWFLPILAGERRSFEPKNAEQGMYWTSEYPTVAVLPMAALVKSVVSLPFDQAKIPALFWFSASDQVVRADITQSMSDRGGGPVQIELVEVSDGIDPSGNVLVGDIMSKAGTVLAVRGMLRWLREQGL